MAYLDVQFYSRALGLSTAMGVILPEPDLGVDDSVWDGVEPLPVLYLLHGMSDNHSIWMRRSSLDRYAAGRRMAIVMPEAGRSYYTDQEYGLAYQRFIGEELPAICRRFFRISDDREKNFIAGLSMGGYGALKIALNYPDRFGCAASMSGVLDLKGKAGFGRYGDLNDAAYLVGLKERDFESWRRAMDFKTTFGSAESFEGSEGDLETLIGRLAASGKPFPALRLSIGTEDYLYDTNLTLRRKLDECGVSYIYTEFPGKHEWAVWDREIQNVLDWLPVQRMQPKGNGCAERAAKGWEESK